MVKNAIKLVAGCNNTEQN